MKTINYFAAALMIFASVAANAQQARRQGPEYKSVVENAAEKSVTFSIHAPKAHAVTLTGDFTGVLEEGANGIWSVTIKNVEPGSYRYKFVVDGHEVIDPLYPEKNDILPMTDVHFGQEMFWDVKDDIQHGLMSSVYYKSSTMGQTRRMHIWTPAGYNTKFASKALPVFYLLHGGGDNDNGWPVIGCAGEILDNLYAEGKIVPMIVVMTDGSIPVEKYASELVNDVMPYIESNYKVKKGAANTALAGLSMGGMQILEILQTYPDKFQYVNIMSSGWFISSDEVLKTNTERLKAVAPTLKKTVKYLRFTQGGPEDIAYKNGMRTLEVFKELGFEYEYSEMPGGHNWYVWRYDLHHFAQQIFKK